MPFEQNPVGVANLNDAQELVSRPDAGKIRANFDFYYGDHWQDATAWAGPIPDSSHKDYATIAEEIQVALQSSNAIKEVVDRAANGVVGLEPIWDIVPNRVITEDKPITDEEQAKIDEARQLLKDWIEDKEFILYLSKALRQTLLAGKSCLRLFIPPGFVQGGVVGVNTNDPLGNIFLDSPHPLSATVFTDSNTREKMGVFLGKIGDTDTAELVYLLPVANERGQRITEISLITGHDNPDVASISMDLAGKMPLFQMEMPRLITDQIASLQRGLNVYLTMMLHNGVTGGFIERLFSNSQEPGTIGIDPNTGAEVLIRQDYEPGAGSVTHLVGLPIRDESGNITNYTTPGVEFREPVSPDTFIRAIDVVKKYILQEAEQLHALLTGDAVTTGESRRQAVASFYATLKTPKQQVDRAGRWCLETALAYADFLTGQPGRFSDLRINFNARLDTGALMAAELDMVERLIRIGVMSVETARERLAIPDPELEARRVAKEREARGGQDITSRDNTSVETGMELTKPDNNDKTNDGQEEQE